MCVCVLYHTICPWNMLSLTQLAHYDLLTPYGAIELGHLYTCCFIVVKRAYTGFTLSVCPSALYLPQYLPDPFHFYISYQPTSDGVSRVKCFFNCKLNLCRFLLLVVGSHTCPWPMIHDDLYLWLHPWSWPWISPIFHQGWWRWGVLDYCINQPDLVGSSNVLSSPV